MSPKVGQIVRGKFVYRGGLSGAYFVANARRVLGFDDGGVIHFEVIGQKWDVTEDVERLIEDEIKRRGLKDGFAKQLRSQHR